MCLGLTHTSETSFFLFLKNKIRTKKKANLVGGSFSASLLNVCSKRDDNRISFRPHFKRDANRTDAFY